MEGTADFRQRSWEDGGTLEAFEVEADKDGKLKPKVKVINPGLNDRKGTGYMYLIICGFIEDANEENPGNKKRQTWCLGSFPLGVGKSHASPEQLLNAILALDVTVRRTAGYDEKLVFGTGNIKPDLHPWSSILSQGAVFPALKVCSSVETIPLDRPLRFRPVFLTITMLTDAGVYKVPKNILEFRYRNAISFNLLVSIKIGGEFQHSGIKGQIDENGDTITTFMVHIGNFARKNGKVYSADYCKQKVERMDLRFSLGAVGGLSLHVRVGGKMSKVLRAQLGYRKVICYSLMDTNPFLNRLMWKYECSISKITAVFQPSVPIDFKIYEDVLIDHTGKILTN
ncbi:matrix protein [Wenzhou Myotis davidii paramyxovirus 1]|uniref:Matrix protein n=1 Tax=Wenzhou Myotis davidii paramyxovirus 1 TaxID=2928979 RepID=A0A8T9KQA3_9MONO|nr:matrix protein [Wenzhou Myotis davidii paramyxovirus 1]WPV62571.1 MAG: matrix protein [Wenzhou bat jeilongvirus 1]